MVYSSGQVGEQSFSLNPTFDLVDVDDNAALSLWVDETQFDSLGPPLEESYGGHLPPPSQWDSLPDSYNNVHYPPPVQSTFESFGAENASVVHYSAQQQDYQAIGYTPYNLSANDAGTAIPFATPIVFQVSESPTWSHAPRDEPFSAPALQALAYSQDAPGQYYPGQVLDCATDDYLRYLDALLQYSATAPTPATENTYSIEPLQMHLPSPTVPPETEAYPEEKPVVQVQTASSSSMTLEQLPPQAPSSCGRKRKRASEYETPNSIELGVALAREGEDDLILERCRKYREVLKDGRIICRCAQDPELRRFVDCRGLAKHRGVLGYRGDHEWKRAHKTTRDAICANCHKSFRRKDSMTKHRKQCCDPKTRGSLHAPLIDDAHNHRHDILDRPGSPVGGAMVR